MGPEEINSVNIFNSPVVSARALSKLAYNLLIKLFGLIKKHWVVLGTFVVGFTAIYVTNGPHTPVSSI